MRVHPRVNNIIFFILLIISISSLISAPIALLCGIIFASIFRQPNPKAISKLSSLLLKIAVVGLGFGMNIYSAMEASKSGFWLTVCSIVFTLVFGYLLGKALKLNGKLAYLISGGTAICGGSAIAAISPAIDASSEDISLSLGVVFLLNSLALFVFPIIGHLIGMGDNEFGLWCAIAIHDTSSVVGAASSYSEQALSVATTVKLARALWIIPLTVFSMLAFKSKNTKIKLPYFIFVFIAVVIANTFIPSLSYIAPYCVKASKSVMVCTLFLIGTSISLKSIKQTGIKPLMLGVILWIAIGSLSLAAIINMN